MNKENLLHNALILDRLDWRAYLDKYADLRRNGVLTEEQAKVHWQKYGWKEDRIFFIKDQTSIQFPQVLPGEIWGIAAYFNPAGYRNKLTNYRLFRKSSMQQGLKLLVVELAFGNRAFELDRQDAEQLIQIRGTDQHMMWQKEALLNIALKNLPAVCDKVVWIDTDILFQNDEWVNETAKLLETYKVVQPYETAVRMPKGETDFIRYSDTDAIEYGTADERKMISYAHYWSNFKSYGAAFRFYQTGYVWAARREILDKNLFYDRAILDGGDRILCCSFYNRPINLSEHLMHEPLIKDSTGWAQQIYQDVLGSVHFTKGAVFHLWHGSLIDRLYDSRQQILISSGFDVRRDIRKNEQGIWQWVTNDHKLKRAVSDYFLLRNEENSWGHLVMNSVIKGVEYCYKRIAAMIDPYDWNDYLERYKDLALVDITRDSQAKSDWYRYGRDEGRVVYQKTDVFVDDQVSTVVRTPVRYAGVIDADRVSKIFDWERYVLSSPDLMKSGINTKKAALQHWLTYGRQEGRGLFVKKSSIPIFPKKLNGEFWAITVLFNPAGYHNKLDNYRLFRDSLKKQGLKLLTVELVFDQQDFQLAEADAEKLIQLRGNAQHMMWQKEALLNIALSHLPDGCDKVAWLDADIIFQDSGWGNETAALLEQYKVVQPYTHAVRLMPGVRELSKFADPSFLKFGKEENHKMVSYAYYWNNHHQYHPRFDSYHPGFAWAARKEDLMKIGFFDQGIIGSGDTYMSLGFNLLDYQISNSFLLNYLIRSMTPSMAEDFQQWLRKADECIQGSMYYGSGTVLHLWHGALTDRRYSLRRDILLKADFDTHQDMIKNGDGIWEWSTAKTGLKDSVADYFRSRQESGAFLFNWMRK